MALATAKNPEDPHSSLELKKYQREFNFSEGKSLQDEIAEFTDHYYRLSSHAVGPKVELYRGDLVYLLRMRGLEEFGYIRRMSRVQGIFLGQNETWVVIKESHTGDTLKFRHERIEGAGALVLFKYLDSYEAQHLRDRGFEIPG